MSLSSILQHVKKKGQVPNQAQNDPKPQMKTPLSRPSGPPNNERRVDPVVARLKEKRRLENEQKEREAREKKGLAPKKAKAPPKQPKQPKQSTPNPSNPRSSHGSTSTRNGNGSSKASINGRSHTLHKPSTNPSSTAPKKMSFNDLMKRASKIDQSKLSISLQSKNRSPEAQAPKPRSQPHSRASSAPAESKDRPLSTEKLPSHRSISRPNYSKNHRDSPKPPQEHRERAEPVSRGPLPIRKPSSQLEIKLKAKKGNSASSNKQRNHNQNMSRAEEEYDSYDDDNGSLDSFIESDDEYEHQRRKEAAADYDRDEIWAIFNKGKKRSYYDRYDDDSDDMEATGAEIFEEEMRSKRNAELEDKREMEEERRLAALKQAKKMRK